MKLTPERAGELLADYIAVNRDFHSNAINSLTYGLQDVDLTNKLRNELEAIWETKFWRTLYLEGHKEIEKEIRSIKA